MFDRVIVRVRSGGGGDGSVSFRREKFVPLGGPDGGDGGSGGSVVLKVDKNIGSLIAYRWRKVYGAEDGKPGSDQRRHGRSGKDLVLLVPPGTIVSDVAQFEGWVGGYDLLRQGQLVVVAKGGRGGLGNRHFASATNQAPLLAQKGETGEEKSIQLELKLIADVGIIGYPNVGKSSLLAAASAAKPKIAGYPFTTLEPVLGVVEVGPDSFTMAEIPGLISGAHLGRGLGHDFLRHVARTKVLIHLIDGSSPAPAGDMIQVNNELSLFDSALAKKPQMVVVNKIDLPEVRARLAELRETFSSIGIAASFVSAAAGEGVAGLMAETWEALARAADRSGVVVNNTLKEFHPEPVGEGASVSRQGDTLVVVAPELERVAAGTDIADPEARRQLVGYFSRPAVKRALKKAGVKAGDKIRCGGFKWQW